MTKDSHDNISNTNLQSNVNPVIYEPVNLDIGLTQESQEDFDFRDGVEIEPNEGRVDNFHIEYPITYK